MIQDSTSSLPISKEPIAIVGIGCRFPGDANSPAKFWQLLKDGVDAIQEVPSNRWNLETFFHPDPVEPGKTYSRWGGFIKDIDRFDRKFFGINRQEAMRLDPQHRHLLEVTWEALENAGIPPSTIAGTNTGVFLGMSFHDYPDIQMSKSECHLLNAYSIMGAGDSGASSRISYWFDLHGPSMCIDTACSSSLVATHLACQSIWIGESEMALAAGANLILKPETTVAMSKAFILSADGHCKSFSAEADGYVRGEGIGVVVLKPLSQAVQDNDFIYALIHASVVNQDGHKSSLAAPNGAAQEWALRRAYEQAGISPETVQYIEAQGTGTLVGDPIEASAIGAVVGPNRASRADCLLGSVKTNIGHTEGAAGIAGLIKTALALHHKKIPPNLHFQNPNPKIPFKELHLRVPRTYQSWPIPDDNVCWAGVNSFGMGGTNAHVVLTDAASNFVSQATASLPKLNATDSQQYLFPLSAKTEPALKAYAQTYLEFLATHDDLDLGDICYTASMRRTHHPEYRTAFVIHSKADLITKLTQFVIVDSNPKPDGTKVNYLSDWQNVSSDSDEKQIKRLVAGQQLYLLGYELEWQRLYPIPGRLVHLPTYPWQHQIYWHESEQSRESRIGRPEHPLQVMLNQLTSIIQDEFNKMDGTEFIDWEKLLTVSATERQPLLTAYLQERITTILQRAAFKLGEQDPLSTLEFKLKETSTDSVPITYPVLQQLKRAPLYNRHSILESHVREQVADVLGLDTGVYLDPEQGFFAMGMDSLQAIALRNNLRLTLGCSLPATSAFKYPTIQSLIDYLITEALPLDFSKTNTHPMPSSPYQNVPKQLSSTMIPDLETRLETDNETELLNLLLESLGVQL